MCDLLRPITSKINIVLDLSLISVARHPTRNAKVIWVQFEITFALKYINFSCLSNQKSVNLRDVESGQLLSHDSARRRGVLHSIDSGLWLFYREKVALMSPLLTFNTLNTVTNQKYMKTTPEHQNIRSSFERLAQCHIITNPSEKFWY